MKILPQDSVSIPTMEAVSSTVVWSFPVDCSKLSGGAHSGYNSKNGYIVFIWTTGTHLVEHTVSRTWKGTLYLTAVPPKPPIGARILCCLISNGSVLRDPFSCLPESYRKYSLCLSTRLWKHDVPAAPCIRGTRWRRVINFPDDKAYCTHCMQEAT